MKAMKNQGKNTMNLLKAIMAILFFLFLVLFLSCRNPKEEPSRYPFQDIPLVEQTIPDFVIHSLDPG
jgi:hypothetical protein